LKKNHVTQLLYTYESKKAGKIKGGDVIPQLISKLYTPKYIFYIHLFKQSIKIHLDTIFPHIQTFKHT